MKIFVKTLSKPLTLFISPTDTVQSVKKMILLQKNIPLYQQRLIFAGKELDDNNLSLEKYGILNESTLHLIIKDTQISSDCIKIMIKAIKFPNLSLDVHSYDTIGSLKS